MNLKLFLFIFLLLPFVSSLCEDGQIDINSATKEELDKLIGIGEVKAQAIIDNRNYNSIEDLLNVPGIGKVTLEKIKTQNLACIKEVQIESETEKEMTEKKEETKEENKKTEKIIKEITPIEKIDENKPSEIIYLNPKTIKTTENSKNNKAYAKYALGLFCIILTALFLFKKKEKKNEFT